MTYLENVNRLGGIRKMYLPSDTKLNTEDVKQLEKQAGGILPKSFSEFISRFGICSFNEEIEFKSFSNDAEFIHDDEAGLPNFTFESSTVSVFYGIDPEEDKTYDIFENLKLFKDRIPDAFLPFATDGMGNQILISLNKDNYGRIYFWDHEAEWDVEDYEEETGIPMREEVKYQNLWLIGNDFEDFFNRLQILDN